MIQHHYKSICGTGTYSPRNQVIIKSIKDDNTHESLHVIDDLHNSTGKTFNLFYYSEARLADDDFLKLVAQEVQKVQGFEYIDSEYLKASEFIDEVQP